MSDTAEYWMEADQHLLRAYEITHELTAPAHFIVHSLSDVNNQLTRGRPFFVDMVKDGIALYETPDHPFARPAKLSPQEAYAEAKANFENWFPSASGFADQASYAITNSRNNIAAFELHQAAERFYHCVLLTMTLHSTKSHNLNFLRSQAERVEPQLIAVWPRSNRFEKRCWELLKRAYVEARFSSHYAITAEELAWLEGRVAELQARVERTCNAYLAMIEPKS